MYAAGAAWFSSEQWIAGAPFKHVEGWEKSDVGGPQEMLPSTAADAIILSRLPYACLPSAGFASSLAI